MFKALMYVRMWDIIMGPFMHCEYLAKRSTYMSATYMLNFKKALFDSAKANKCESLCKCFVKTSLESYEKMN